MNVFLFNIFRYIPEKLDWDKRQLLGQGSYGRVFKCPINGQAKLHGGMRYLRGPKPVAVKVLTAKDLTSIDVERDESNLRLSHPNVIRIHGLFKINDEGPEQYSTSTAIMMEFANLGSLEQHYKSLDENKRIVVGLDVSKGLQYLHSKSLIHRDLKLENVVLVGETERTKGLVAKITDFGLTRKVETYMTNLIGTFYYMAPELVANKPKYDFKVDIYSLSILMFELYTKARFPFKCQDMQNKMAKIQAVKKSEKPKIPDGIPRQISSLISNGWSKDPETRPKTDIFVQVFQIMKDSIPKEAMNPTTSSEPSTLYQNFEYFCQTFFSPHPPKGSVPPTQIDATCTLTKYLLIDARNKISLLSSNTDQVWSATLEEGNSKETRLNEVKIIQNFDCNTSDAFFFGDYKILPNVYAAMKVVPKHCFKTGGRLQYRKFHIVQSYWGTQVQGISHDSYELYLLGLMVSLLGVDIGHDVLLLEPSAYEVALVSHIVGPNGSVVVLDNNDQQLQTIKDQLEKCCRMEQRNFEIHYMNAKAAEKVRIRTTCSRTYSNNDAFFFQILHGKQFDSIFGVFNSFSEDLCCLLKERGSLVSIVTVSILC